MSLAIVTHRLPCKRKARTLALIERDIHAIRTRVYAHSALRAYFRDEQRAALADRLERLMVAMGMGGRPHD